MFPCIVIPVTFHSSVISLFLPSSDLWPHRRRIVIVRIWYQQRSTQLRPTMVSDLDWVFYYIVNQDRTFCLFLKLYLIENYWSFKAQTLRMSSSAFYLPLLGCRMETYATKRLNASWWRCSVVKNSCWRVTVLFNSGLCVQSCFSALDRRAGPEHSSARFGTRCILLPQPCCWLHCSSFTYSTWSLVRE